MNSAIWAQAHGATTHFPLALTLCSVACDVVGFALGERPPARELHATGYWTMLLGALGSIAAVFSGVLMTKGSVLGHGALRMHHVFVWPAFGVLIALATWRSQIRGRATRAMVTTYLAGVSLTGGLLLAAAYWGGELLLAR
jgi:uncharacterized membrane protein